MAALWTGEFHEDWRYAFAVGALRVLQTRLLESSRLNDLANSLNLDEMITRLAGTPYSPSTEGSTVSQQIEARLKHLRRAAYELIIPMCLDEPLKRFLQGPEDFRNLKILLRCTLIENSPELPLSDLGFIPPEKLQQDFEAEKYDSFEPDMAQAVQDAIVDYYDDKNPRNIDLAVDRKALSYRRTLARQLNNEYLLHLCDLLADLGNIRSMARLKWLEEDSKLLARAFLPGGSIELARLRAAMSASWEAISAMFFATPYTQLVEHGLGSLAADDSFGHLERYCDDYLTEYLKATNQVVAGPEPLVAYLLGAEQEIRSVRLIFSAKQANLPADTIRDRLAVSFAT